MHGALIERLNRALSGRYRILRPLGEGATATVFLAVDMRHERRVALKVLSEELTIAVGTRRFLAEIRTTASLRHPHILPLFDSGEADGLLFQVTPYLEGETLRARLERESQLPIDEVVRIAREVADALDHAHAAGVIHRDVKPENILFDAGHAVVCDFGIAKALSDVGDERLTRTGLAVGTPSYVSPEQATAATIVDRRTDVYSLACVVYEMLIGGPPYSGPTPQALLARKVTEPMPGMRVVRGTIRPEMEAAIRRALAAVPADRFPTAGDFARSLSAEQVPAAVRRRLPWLRPAIAVAAAGVLVALAVDLARRFGRPDTLSPASFAQATAHAGVESSPTLTPNGEWLAYAGEGPRGRDIFLQSVGGRLPINLTEDAPEDDSQPAFSPSGERIAFRSERAPGGLYLMGRTGETVRRVSGRGFNPTWSPDGTRLAYATEGVELFPLNWESISELWVVDVEGGDERRIYDRDGVQPSWSPDGGRIAFTARAAATSQMDIWTVPVEGGEPTRLTDDAPADWSPTWSADGRYLHFVSDRGGSMNLWRVRVEPTSGRSLAPPEPLSTPASFVAHPTVAADGRLVAYAAVQHSMNIERAALDWRRSTLGERSWLTTGSRQWSSPDISGDGDWVVFYSQNLPEGDLYVTRADTASRVRQVTDGEAVDRVPRWSPDGAWIAYFSTRDGPFQTWVIRADGSDERRITAADVASFGTWAPDGSRFAVNGLHDPTRAEVYVFDPHRPWSDQRVDTLPAPDPSIGRFQVNDWSPDGTKLAGMIVPLTDLGVIVHELATGAYVRLTEFGQWPVWLPDSRHLLFVTGGSELWIVDSGDGSLERLYVSDSDVMGPPRVSADGETIVYTRRVTEADIWTMTLGSPGSARTNIRASSNR